MVQIPKILTFAELAGRMLNQKQVEYITNIFIIHWALIADSYQERMTNDE